MSRRKILESEYSSRNKEPFSKFSNGSHKKVWWKCTKSGCSHPHEWEAVISSRTKDNGTGCPFCSGRNICSCDSLQTLNPDISAEWHHEKNISLKPSEVSVSSHKKVWWKCLKMGCDHHEWEATIKNRTNGRGCPFCAGQKVCPCNSLQTLKPDIATEWHPQKNNSLKPSEVTVGSYKKVWWKCPKSECNHPHEWETVISVRTKGHGCPFCLGFKVCPCNSLETWKPDILSEWHPRNSLKPSEVSVSSGKKVWWKCTKMGCDHHEWEAIIKSRTRGNGCPFCAGYKVCPCNSLQTLEPDISAECHPRNTLKPSEVPVGSHKKVWWKCLKMGCDHHEWEATIANRTNDRGCPFCAGKKICPCNSLQTIKPDIAAEWHHQKNISLKPSEVTVGSGKKVWWKCLKKGCDHHIWEATVNHRTGDNGSGCPFCRKSKGEDKIMKILENRKINYIFQKRLNYRGLSLDFFLPDSNTAIEFDGIQHFEPVEYFGGEETFLKQRENDSLKNIYCSNNGINLLRIHYEDMEEIEYLLEVVFISKPFGENIYILLSTNYNI
jgi:very-short-patch-repair endonuclease